MSLDALITNSHNMEEKISAVEFIKTLKKVQDTRSTTDNSDGSNASGSSDKMVAGKVEDDKKKLADKKMSTSDLLGKMRSRFQHRATEPVFHTLAINSAENNLEQQTSSGQGSSNALMLPQIQTLSHERRTDSVPTMRRLSLGKYMTRSTSYSNLSKL